MRHSVRALALALVVLCAPASAHAHLVSTRFGQLYGGLLHALLGLEHVLVWIGLGLLGGFQATHVARWLVLVLPASVAAGAVLGGMLPPVAAFSQINLLSIVAVGALVVLALELPAAAFVSLSVLIGLCHGFANGAPELAAEEQLLYVTGATLAAYVLVTPVAALARRVQDRARWGGTALRAAGSWVVAIGVVSVAFTLVQKP